MSSSRPPGKLFLKTICLLIVFVPLIKIFQLLFYDYVPTYTNARAYFEPSIVLYSLNNGLYLFAVVGLMVPIVFCWDRIDWRSFEHPGGMKIFLVVLTLPLVWVLLTSAHNFAFSQWHAVDRMMLLLFWGLLILHPGFVAPLLVVLFALISQLNYGPEKFRMIYFQPPLLVLLLFLGFLYLKTFLNNRDSVFCVTGLGLLVIHYFNMGWVKASFGDYFFQWPLTADIHLGLMTFHFMGWLNFMPDWMFYGLSATVDFFNRPLVIGVFIMEITSLLLFLSRRMTYLYLGLFFAFHTSVFLLFGVFFWAWMAVLVAFGFLVWTVTKRSSIDVYSREFLLAGLLVVGVLFFSQTVDNDIVWWDLRSNYAMRLVAENQRGERFNIRRTNFAPYHRNFFLSVKQEYLIPRRFLPVSTYDYQTFRAVNRNLNTSRDFFQLRRTVGLERFQSKNAEMFRQLLRRYLINYRKSDEFTRQLNYYLSYLRFPMLNYSTYNSDRKLFSEVPGQISKMHLVFTEGFFNGKKNITVEENIIQTIDVD